MDNRRLICNLDAALLERVDAYAQRMHITRTAAVAVLLSRGLETDAAPAVLPGVGDETRTLLDTIETTGPRENG